MVIFYSLEELEQLEDESMALDCKEVWEFQIQKEPKLQIQVQLQQIPERWFFIFK